MCWDISLHSDIEIVKKAFPALKDQRRNLDYDLSQMEDVWAWSFPDYPIIYREKETGELALTEMEWGVYPLYLDGKGKTQQEIDTQRRNQVNARSERIVDDPKSLWYRMKNQRCLIPVSGIFEHRKIKTWKKKVPYYITEKGRDLFYIPGLYQFMEVVDEDGVVERKGNFAMITRSANEVMAGIHNDGNNKHRMPLFLPETMEKEWLADITPLDMAEIFSYQLPSDQLTYTPVFSLRNAVRMDGKHLYEPFDWQGLPPLGSDDPGSVQTSLF